MHASSDQDPGTGHERTALDALQQRLGHRFADARLLQRALTHRSFSADHNERLEFLGDAVLDLVVAHLLYDAPSDLPEGDLSRIRAKLVRQQSLQEHARELGLQPLLRLGAGERHSGGRGRPSILADALEALIGAVYLDGGFDAADRAVRALFASVRLTPELSAAARDAKTSLQEWLQARRMSLPSYSIDRVTGAAHQQTFEVRCSVAELSLVESGQGRSRRAAEQAAAAAMLGALTRREKER